MGDSAIDYLGENGKSWSPVRGCSRVSEGCRHCWAERMAIRFAGWKLRDASKAPRTETPGLTHGLVRSTPSGPRWTGEVRLIEKDLNAPLRWRKPARIATVFSGDWCHPSVPDEWRDRMLATVVICDGQRQSGRRRLINAAHTFLTLTKRAEVQRAYMSDPETPYRVAAWVTQRYVGYRPSRWSPDWRPWTPWPPPMLHLGVSVESADCLHRIADLIATPAAVRWVSLEPLLGAVDVARWLPERPYHCSDCPCLGCLDRRAAAGYPTETPYLSWLVVGGESGPGARPCDLAWIRSIVEQGKAAGVPVYVKQLGARPVYYDGGVNPICRLRLRNRKGADPSEWPNDLRRVQEMPR